LCIVVIFGHHHPSLPGTASHPAFRLIDVDPASGKVSGLL